MWILPPYHGLDEVASRPLGVKDLERLIQEHRLHPNMILYKSGEPVQPAIRYTELRAFYARHWPPTGDLLREAYGLDDATLQRFAEECAKLERDHGATMILPSSRRVSRKLTPENAERYAEEIRRQVEKEGDPADRTNLLDQRIIGGDNIETEPVPGPDPIPDDVTPIPSEAKLNLREMFDAPPPEPVQSDSGRVTFQPANRRTLRERVESAKRRVTELPPPDPEVERSRSLPHDLPSSRIRPNVQRIELTPALASGLISGLFFYGLAWVLHLVGVTSLQVRATQVTDGVLGLLVQVGVALASGGSVGLLGAVWDWHTNKEPRGPVNFGVPHGTFYFLVGFLTFFLFPGAGLLIQPPHHGLPEYSVGQGAIWVLLGFTATAVFRLSEGRDLLPGDQSPWSKPLATLFFVSVMGGLGVAAVAEITAPAAPTTPQEVHVQNVRTSWQHRGMEGYLQVDGEIVNPTDRRHPHWSMEVRLLDTVGDVMEERSFQSRPGSQRDSQRPLEAGETRAFKLTFRELKTLPSQTVVTIDVEDGE